MSLETESQDTITDITMHNSELISWSRINVLA